MERLAKLQRWLSSDRDDSDLPRWSDLPFAPKTQLRCAWGLFDGSDGSKDELGTLNLLTPSRALKTVREEVKTGESVSLNWGLENCKFPGFGRQGLSHTLIDHEAANAGIGMDDEIHFNTQCGSQWDSLRHVGCQKLRQYYNGVEHDRVKTGATTANGLHNVSKRGGIVARGVLLDWVSWAERQGIAFDPTTRHIISIEQLEAVAEAQNIELQVGDVLLIRSGFVRWHNQAADEERKRGTRRKNLEYIGVENSERSAAWHWDHHFAAVGGDTVAYEAWPPSSPWLHEHLLAMQGTLIGEMWDLEGLAAMCQQHGKYSFLLTSSPLNVAGGVGSPPNAIAIF